MSVDANFNALRWVAPGQKERLVRLVLLLLTLLQTLFFLALPLGLMLWKSLQNGQGEFIGLANFQRYFTTPSLAHSTLNTLVIGAVCTATVLTLAFLSAYGLTRTRMPGKRLFRLLTSFPILAPSLLPAISLVYLFGNQGFAKSLLGGISIYGPAGIILGMCFWIYPHALMLLTTALSASDGRLYEAARSLRTPPWRIFFTITLPGARYGLVSCAFVVFTLTITDFGVPKMIGGQYNLLATDIYRQVVGQQNFQMGAVVSVLLLLPAILSFIADRLIQKKQMALLSSRSTLFVPERRPWIDLSFFMVCYALAAFIVLVIGTAVYASLIHFWPYNLTLTLKHYAFEGLAGDGWNTWWNSLKMAALVSSLGTLIIFTNAWLIEKGRDYRALRQITHMLSMLPMAIPGLVLGLSYIFFFNHPWNPLGGIYGTMTILVINTIVHYYTVCHLTSVTSLKQLDAEFEAVGASLKVPFWSTYLRVTLPVSMPAILDISVYLFVNAMTTVSSVVFLYSSHTKLASIAIVHLDEAGYFASAAAMAVLILLTSGTVKGLHALISRGLFHHSQKWRKNQTHPK